MYRKPFCVLIALLILLAFPLSGCDDRRITDAPSEAPISSPIPTEAPTPMDEEPNGGYELNDSDGTLTVFLSSEQGYWAAESFDSQVLDVSDAGVFDGFRFFRIMPIESGSCDLLFRCERDGQPVSHCRLELFVNEAYVLEVVSSDIEAGNAPDDTKVREPIDFTLDYEKYPELLKEYLGEKIIADAQLVIRAFLNGETSVPISPVGNASGYANSIGCALNIMCPPFEVLTDYNSLKAYKNGRLNWNFLGTWDETCAALADFEASGNGSMECLDKRDGETAAAMLLYSELTKGSCYDYSFIESTDNTPEQERLVPSAYNAIVNKSGICASFSLALTFLYSQAGIDSIAVSGEAPDSFHMWTMVRLGEELYFADPTWDLGGGFKYFGITAADRCGWAGGFDAASFYFCGQTLDLSSTVTSERFAVLHESLDEGSADFRLFHSTQLAVFCYGMFSFDCADR